MVFLRLNAHTVINRDVSSVCDVMDGDCFLQRGCYLLRVVESVVSGGACSCGGLVLFIALTARTIIFRDVSIVDDFGTESLLVAWLFQLRLVETVLRWLTSITSSSFGVVSSSFPKSAHNVHRAGSEDCRDVMAEDRFCMRCMFLDSPGRNCSGSLS